MYCRKIKREHGSVWLQQGDNIEEVEVPSIGGRRPKKINKQVLTQILQARAEEIFQMFLGELQKSS